MRYYFSRVIIPVIIITLFSCGTSRLTESIGENIPRERRQYIEKYSKLAVNEMKRTGIPASITLAQGILESDNGNSRLAIKANNHFGIKCHNNWTGRRIYHDDDSKRECFRKYSSAVESYRDHSDFISNTPRYALLFKLDKDNYKGWAKGLKKAGYATDRKYDDRLIKIIEENGLYQYDNLRRVSKRSKKKKPGNKESISEARSVNSNNPSGRVLNSNRIDYIIVKESDTYRSLEKDFELMHWEIFKYNDLPEDYKLKPGMILYLQPKRRKAAAGNDFHFVEKGETMHGISQKYGIKLDRLLKMNRMKEGDKPVPGEKLWLRKSKPDSKKNDEGKDFEIEFDS